MSSASYEECPVCQNQIPSDNIESHVNQCFDLQAEKIQQKSPAVTSNNKKRSLQLPSTSKSYDIFNVNRSKKPKIENEIVKNEVKSSEKKEERKLLQGPLAEVMRPTEFEDYCGQKQAVGDNSIIRNLLNNNVVTSSIFYGPPGLKL
jgi:hypothetical protein